MYKDKKTYNAYMKNYMRQYQGKAYSKRITVKLTPEDYVKFKQLAQQEDKALSTCIRELALTQFQDFENYPFAVKKQFSEFIQVLRGIGNNINQIARHSNQFREFIQREELHQQLKDLEQQTQHFLTCSHK